MVPVISALTSLLPEGGKAFVAALHPDMLRAWMEALPDAPPEQIAEALREQLRRVRSTANPRSRLKMLDVLFDATGRVAAAVEADLHRARHPLSLALQRRVIAGNELLKLHAHGYREAAEKLSNAWIGRRRNLQRLRPALARAMQLESRRLLLAYRAYTPGSKSAWRSLHALYRLARSQGDAGTLRTDAPDCPDRLYALALLTALAEPTRLAPGELDRLRFYLERHIGLAQLRDPLEFAQGPEACEGCFLIRRHEDSPGRSLRKWNPVEFAKDDLVLDCGPLLRKLREQLDALTHGAMPSRIGLPAVARKPEYVAMLKNIAGLWSLPPTRRHSRQHFRPRIDLVTGFDDLWSFVSGPAFKRRRGDDARPGAPGEPALSQWSVFNESPAGFALHYLSGECEVPAVGALVGLRPEDRRSVHVCIVRRFVTGSRGRPELGLQKYAPAAVPTTIAVNGGSGEQAPIRAIVLPRVPSLRGAAVIAPPGRLHPGKRVSFVLDGHTVTLLTGAPVERWVSYEIFPLGDLG